MHNCVFETFAGEEQNATAGAAVTAGTDCIVFCKRISAFNDKKKIGIYISDIASAFDKVHTVSYEKDRAGFNKDYISFIKAYLAEHSAIVVHGGAVWTSGKGECGRLGTGDEVLVLLYIHAHFVCTCERGRERGERGRERESE